MLPVSRLYRDVVSAAEGLTAWANNGRLIARLSGFIENPARFFVILPLSSGILLCHERLLAHKKQIEPPAGFARFAQGEIERAPGAADGAQDRFAAVVGIVTRNDWSIRNRDIDRDFLERMPGFCFLFSSGVPGRGRAGSIQRREW